jgi:hypothetical protein
VESWPASEFYSKPASESTGKQRFIAEAAFIGSPLLHLIGALASQPELFFHKVKISLAFCHLPVARSACVGKRP